MKKNILNITLHIEKKLLRKFQYIAKSECRSANKDIEQYIKRKISVYEQKHGQIPDEDL